MSNKTKIIILSVILSIFLITIICIVIFHKKPAVDEIQQTSEHNYAINEVKDREDAAEPEESTEVSEKTISLGNVEIIHAERLTYEQSADRQGMVSKLDNRVATDIEEHGNVVSEEILDTSTEFQVYVEVTFEDSAKQTYICSYDATNMHSFLRCVSLEEWEYYESGENAG